MNFKEVEKLIELFSKNSISKIHLKEGEFEIKLEKTLQTLPSPSITPPIPQLSAPKEQAPQELPQVKEASSGEFIESPMVGTFYRCPAPNAAPYINVGEKIKKGQIIGIVEAMKIMNEIEAEFDCQILEIIASDAQPVEFGSKLIRVKKI